MGIFAMNDIPVGEELSYDYQFQHYGLAQAAGAYRFEFVCHCDCMLRTVVQHGCMQHHLLSNNFGQMAQACTGVSFCRMPIGALVVHAMLTAVGTVLASMIASTLQVCDMIFLHLKTSDRWCFDINVFHKW